MRSPLDPEAGQGARRWHAPYLPRAWPARPGPGCLASECPANEYLEPRFFHVSGGSHAPVADMGHRAVRGGARPGLGRLAGVRRPTYRESSHAPRSGRRLVRRLPSCAKAPRPSAGEHDVTGLRAGKTPPAATNFRGRTSGRAPAKPGAAPHGERRHVTEAVMGTRRAASNRARCASRARLPPAVPGAARGRRASSGAR